MECPFCNKTIKDDDKICNSCKKVIPRCPKCNRVITRNFPVCLWDGEAIPPQLLVGLPENTMKEKATTTNYVPDIPKDIDNTMDPEKIEISKMEPDGGKDAAPEKRKGSLPWIIGLIILIPIAVIAFLVTSRMIHNNKSVKTEEAPQSTDARIIEKPSEEEASTAEAITPFAVASDQMDKDFVDLWESDNGHAYAVINFSSKGFGSLEALESYCEKMGGHVVTIESQSENDEIYDKLTSLDDKGKKIETAIIGYTDEGSEGKWYWIDGSESEYTNWCRKKGKEQPNNGNANDDQAEENQAEFYLATKDGTWNDTIFGANTHYAICEWE